MQKLWRTLFPTTEQLIQGIRRNFESSLPYLSSGFERELRWQIALQLELMLVISVGRGLPVFFVFNILPFAYFVLFETRPGVSFLPLYYLLPTFVFVTFGSRFIVPRLAPGKKARFIFYWQLAAFIPLGGAVLYYNIYFNLYALLIVLVLLAGAASIIPPFVASHRRMYVTVAAVMFPEIIYFLFFNDKMPELWILGPAIFIYVLALTPFYLIDNARRKKSIITNYFLQNLNQSYAIVNTAFQEANRQFHKAFEEESNLKNQQDGDYFLTSSLIQPFSGGFVESQEYIIETFSRAKTRFKFGRHQTELGGDLNIIDSIYLAGRRFLLVMNADAMGKSMQGAGGALVLGTSLRVILDRTKAGEHLSQLGPGDWLKDTVTELSDIFAQFEGLMLISLVLGLIDEQSGDFLYINAEHPFSVSYMNGEAQFIEDKNNIYKIGSWLNDLQSMTFHHYTIRPNETVILGSDGRDDLRKPNETAIDADPKRFLNVVQEADAGLSKMYVNLRRIGEPTDDISFVSIHRRPAPMPVGDKGAA